MTLNSSAWLAYLKNLGGECENFATLLLKISSVDPDQEDLAVIRTLLEDNQKEGGDPDIVLAAAAIMTTFFPETVDLKVEREFPVELIEEVLKGLDHSGN